MMLRLLALLIVATVPALAAAASVPEPPDIEASSYVLMDFHSGQVLATRNGRTAVEPASITKVMTVYVAFDELKAGHIALDDEVLISERAWRSEGSRSFVEVGKRVRLEDLLHGIIIQSGNDASIALAEHIAGDESVFAQLMNKHAKRLGMKDTHFTNASGLPDPDLLTTAHDIALLSQALIRDFPDLYPWFKDTEFVYNGIRQRNRNLLLYEDRTVDGIKTGHTNAAGYCLAASAIRDDRRLITVVMGTESPRARTRASRALLEYGYRFFETAQLFGADQPVDTLRIYKGASEQLKVGVTAPIALSLPRDAGSRLQVSHTVEGPLEAPVQVGQRVGTVTVTLDGETLRSQPMVALETIAEGSLWQRAADTVRLWLAD
ncbi:D-alanyl-D-alanine carboxypeptidase [Flagellatimonas centrodinii]|uniref:D-alanyl-D-alanine carboxypeptidase family protein n=1 Tax=Flagellatimonas centrodinii TaxID=2806210 RepID=UPI001FEF5A61|nr:D-alanyl-D-alanine carboxypeptidase family protein [Flagellatimonas centrodinii]ULQ46765.1 D-alanyl-D-alanine carboxypeptidase [Flagellatimonas centrodinii]